MLQQPSDMCSNERCSLRVLVVDDDELIRTAIAEVVQEMGVAVTQARDGLEALEALATGPRPCLALVDLMMPRMCGEEFARAVRRMHLDLVIVSMSAGNGALAPPLVEGHVRKPFSIEQLEEVVERHCAAARRVAPKPRAEDVEAEGTSPEAPGCNPRQSRPIKMARDTGFESACDAALFC
jgi:CheY-like chemotaxis protein